MPEHLLMATKAHRHIIPSVYGLMVRHRCSFKPSMFTKPGSIEDAGQTHTSTQLTFKTAREVRSRMILPVF
jgi:hypothetical protein